MYTTMLQESNSEKPASLGAMLFYKHCRFPSAYFFEVGKLSKGREWLAQKESRDAADPLERYNRHVKAYGQGVKSNVLQ